MNVANKNLTIKTGDTAYYDTMRGLQRVKILSITGKTGPSGSNQRVKVKIVGPGVFNKGSIENVHGNFIVPKDAIWRKKYKTIILPYTVIADTEMRSNPRRKICRKAKRLVKRKRTRAQGKALFAEAARKGKACVRSRKRKTRRKHRVANRHVSRTIRARKNPYTPYVVYADERSSRARPGHPRRYYWTGYNFTTDKKFAETFANAESAFNAAKRIKHRLPTRLEFVAVQRSK